MKPEVWRTKYVTEYGKGQGRNYPGRNRRRNITARRGGKKRGNETQSKTVKKDARREEM
jgi:hypothetical protein